MKNWLKRQLTAIAFATGNVGKNILSQEGESLWSTSPSLIQSRKQGTLSDALKKGELTQDVKDLRWRMYKIIQATNNINVDIIGYDESGDPIVNVGRKIKYPLRNVKVDEFDPYKVIMVVDNHDVTLSTLEGSNSDSLIEINEEVRYENGDEIRSIGEIKSDDYFSNIKSSKPINISRTIKARFDIEKYTRKLVIREIDEINYLLEFYISKYVDEFDRKTNLLISTIKKTIINPNNSDLIDFKGVNFITEKTAGAEDHKIYEYVIESFDKIVEYDGHYVIKFIATITIDGEDIFEKYREIALDEKYTNKTKK